MEANDLEKGEQPLAKVIAQLKLKNSDLVEHSKEQLTHKMVAKGCKGRKLTLNAQLKILKALNASQSEKQFVLDDLFNYVGSK